MPEQARQAATFQASRRALRIVLFGLPDAGKSSLLGALAQTAQTQEHLLSGRLTSCGQGLTELQRRLYDEPSRGTLGEVVPFSVTFEPFPTRDQGKPARRDVVLIDCEGQKALDVMTRWRSQGADANQGALGQAILEADAIVLVVDAAADPTRIESDFAEFTRFLGLLEQGRGQRTEVGGLPVFLVLTKCDLLVLPDDDLSAWMEHIEANKRRLGLRFQEFLERDTRAGKLSFGSIRLHLWACAIKRPALRESPAQTREPYGVAELFRQCFEQARAHRARRLHSGRLLLLTVAASIAALVCLAALVVFLFLARPAQDVVELEQFVDHLMARDQDLSPQARHRNVADNIDELAEVQAQPAFVKLSRPRRNYVAGRLRELTAYQEFEKKLDEVSDWRQVRLESQLQAVKQTLADVVPAEYAEEWSQTEAGRRRAVLLEDAQAIDQALNHLLQSYQKLLQDGNQVLRAANEPRLPSRARKVLDDARILPNLPNDPSDKIPGSERVSYDIVFGFQHVRDLRSQWQEMHEKLSIAASLKKPRIP